MVRPALFCVTVGLMKFHGVERSVTSQNLCGFKGVFLQFGEESMANTSD